MRAVAEQAGDERLAAFELAWRNVTPNSHGFVGLPYAVSQTLLAEYNRRGAALARRSAVVEAATAYAAHRNDDAVYLADPLWAAKESVLAGALLAAVEAAAKGGDDAP